MSFLLINPKNSNASLFTLHSDSACNDFAFNYPSCTIQAPTGFLRVGNAYHLTGHGFNIPFHFSFAGLQGDTLYTFELTGWNYYKQWNRWNITLECFNLKGYLRLITYLSVKCKKYRGLQSLLRQTTDQSSWEILKIENKQIKKLKPILMDKTGMNPLIPV